MGSIIKNKYLILRRISQLAILFLYFAANAYGWKILAGNLSFSKIFSTIPLADPFVVLQMLFAGAIISSDLIFGVLIILFVYGVIAGRAYCSWVCPVNMITDFAAWVRRKMGIKDNLINNTKTRNFRYLFLVVLLFVSFFIGAAAFEFINPIGIITRGVAFALGFGWVWLIAIFIFDAFILKNGWCGHICPVGAMYSLIGSKSLIRVYHEKDKCVNCGECLLICPENQILAPIINKKSAFISKIECTNCGRCIEVCESNALKFSLRNYIKGENNEKAIN